MSRTRFLLVLAACSGLALGGCTKAEFDSFTANVHTAYEVVTSAAATPAQLLAAANAFDALEVSASAFLNGCKATGYTTTACARGNRVTLIADVRKARKARDAIEPYITSGGAGPAALYNALMAAISTANSDIPVASN